jgi:hypothetical protein
LNRKDSSYYNMEAFYQLIFEIDKLYLKYEYCCVRNVMPRRLVDKNQYFHEEVLSVP